MSYQTWERRVNSLLLTWYGVDVYTLGDPDLASLYEAGYTPAQASKQLAEDYMLVDEADEDAS